MNIEQEARIISGSIIEWCFDKRPSIDDNYPAHIVEILLKRQKMELTKKACDFLITALNEDQLQTSDIGKLNMNLRKAMEN